MRTLIIFTNSFKNTNEQILTQNLSFIKIAFCSKIKKEKKYELPILQVFQNLA
jgi:hypothetical protein